MNSDEAKHLLHARRLSGEDDDDSRMAEALERARRDPSLAAWHQEQQALDKALCRKLDQIRVPPGLGKTILANRGRLRQARDRRRWLTLAIAASIVLLLALGFLMSGRFQSATTEFAAMRFEMTRYLAEFPQLELATEDWAEITGWLARRPASGPVEIPAGMKKFPGLGCRTVPWRGRSLALVCFVAQGEIVHLFVIPRSDFRDAPSNAAPELADLNGWRAASWARGENVFLTLTRGEEKLLQGLLPPAQRI